MTDNRSIPAEDVRRRVFESVSMLLKTHHPERITTGMITHEAGISKGTLYKHFRNKNDIFTHIILKSLEPWEEKDRQVAYSEMPVGRKLLATAELSISLFEGVATFFPAIMQILAKSADKPSEKIKALRKRSTGRMNDIFKEGIKGGWFGDISSMELVAFFTAAIRSTLIRRSKTPETKKVPQKQDAREMVKRFLYGTAAC